MRGGRVVTSLAAAVVAAGLGGCANSETAATATAPVASEATSVRFYSPAIRRRELPALYTCDGRDVSPPLSWGTVPSGVRELALFALAPASSGSGRKSIDWAMAGVSPALHHLRAGDVPRGAFLELGSGGKRRYSICPHQGQTVSYEFALYALPPIARATPTLGGSELLHNLTEASPEDLAPASGAFSATYTRR